MGRRLRALGSTYSRRQGRGRGLGGTGKSVESVVAQTLVSLITVPPIIVKKTGGSKTQVQ